MASATISRGRSETSFWIAFFENGGISPKDAVQYAVIFMDNKITKNCLSDLTKELLQDMGISAVGHIISILKQAKKYTAAHAASEVLSRIGSATATKSAQFHVKNILQLGDELEEDAVPSTTKSLRVERLVNKPVSPISPDKDVQYTVKLPRGDTERSRMLLLKAKLQKQNDLSHKSGGIFSRLGQPEAMLAERVEKSVFTRLGKPDDAESDADYSEAEAVPSPKKKLISLTPKLQERRLSLPTKTAVPILKKSVSFAKEARAEFGTMEADRVELKRKPSAVARLGVSSASTSRSAGTSASPMQNFVITRMGDRKDVKKALEIAESDSRIKLRASSVKSRLGGLTPGKAEGLKSGTTSTGVFSRLG